MWKLNKEEYSELCSFIEKELKIKTNWVYHIQGENEYGRYHQFNGLNFNSSSYNILKIYFVLGKIEVFKEYEIINEKNLKIQMVNLLKLTLLFLVLKSILNQNLRSLKI